MNEGRSRARKIETDAAPPQAADVVIIGGGILGVCAAYYLAERGVSVTVCEKGVVAGEASGRALGHVASAGLGALTMPLLVESKRCWFDLDERLGDALGYQRNGFMAPCTNAEELGFWEKWLPEIQEFEPEAQILTRAQADRRLTGSKPWQGAYFNPTDGGGEPKMAAPAIAAAARRAGATVVESCAVRGVERTDGRINAVVTEKGTIQTRDVILAGGAWSMLFARSIGLDLPILGIRATCQSVAPVAGAPDGTGEVPGVAWRRQPDGGYLVGVIGGVVPIVPAMARIGLRFLPMLKKHWGEWEMKLGIGDRFFTEMMRPSKWPLDKPSPFEEIRVLEAPVQHDLARSALERIAGTVPAFKDLKVREKWGGVLVTTPDNMPTISPVESIPGLHLLTGFSYGFAMGPGASRLMADLITGEDPVIDPAPYRYERYIDGTKLEVIQ